MSSERSITIGSYDISPNSPPFVIAEMSGNHNQSLERALDIVSAAAAAGAHALKLQTYTADTMTLDLSKGEFYISDSDSLWQGESLYELYRKAYTPWEWHAPIFSRCAELGILCFSTPFDETAVDFLETLDVPAYKVASFENTDIPLLRRVARTGKPVIVSTGMASLTELEDAVSALRGEGCHDFVLLKCTSSYPTPPQDSHLRTIPHLRDLFNCQVGLSDHSLGIGVSLAAVSLGASVIERHVTLDRADGGVDSAFSLEPDELKMLVEESARAWQSLGGVQYGPCGQEKSMLKHRRSLYIVEDCKAGDRLNRKNVRSIRPGLGLAPKYLDGVLGRTLKSDCKKGTPLSWDLLG